MSSDYRYEIKFVLDNSRLADAMQWLKKDFFPCIDYKKMVNKYKFKSFVMQCSKTNHKHFKSHQVYIEKKLYE